MREQSGCGAVLIVEDDAALRGLLAALLETSGFDTVTAHTGSAALEAALRRRPAAAVLDVALPGVSGYEVCHELRQAYGARLPIVFISGERTEPYDRVAGLLVGADDYLTKPFDPEELLVRLRALLERRRSAEPPRTELTRRELEVLTLLAGGLDQVEIGRRLGIRSRTVSAHIEHVLAKLGVHSRAQAVAVAYRDELVAV